MGGFNKESQLQRMELLMRQMLEIEWRAIQQWASTPTNPPRGFVLSFEQSQLQQPGGNVTSIFLYYHRCRKVELDF